MHSNKAEGLSQVGQQVGKLLHLHLLEPAQPVAAVDNAHVH